MFVHYKERVPVSQMLALVCLTGIAGFFALRMDSDPESCLATDESDDLFI